jgi:hypothetical protein
LSYRVAPCGQPQQVPLQQQSLPQAPPQQQSSQQQSFDSVDIMGSVEVRDRRADGH